jgi:1-phosphatidylinositol-3-phosphate 5-kinase
MIDLSAEINQENYNMQIIMSKIQSINPHIIFVEHEASRLALETLFKDQRTVVTNVHPKMMKMIARSTQTIICPSTNLIDRDFIVGNCLKFRVEEIMPMKANVQGNLDISMLTGHTSLMFLEGCQSKLGCSIVLSGPNLVELKNVRLALKKCLATARVFLLEREYLRFIHPDPICFIAVNQTVPEEEPNQ